MPSDTRAETDGGKVGEGIGRWTAKENYLYHGGIGCYDLRCHGQEIADELNRLDDRCREGVRLTAALDAARKACQALLSGHSQDEIDQMLAEPCNGSQFSLACRAMALLSAPGAKEPR